jgi:hypothetical protein
MTPCSEKPENLERRKNLSAVFVAGFASSIALLLFFQPIVLDHLVPQANDLLTHLRWVHQFRVGLAENIFGDSHKQY